MDLSSGKRKIYTITASEMREINRSTILELIRRGGPIGRSQIAEEHNVSLPTVMRIVEGLIDDGLVIEEERKEWSGGRRRSRVRFNGSQHLVLGIDLGGEMIYGAIADLNGDVCYEMRYENNRPQEEDSLELVYQVIDQLLEKAEETGIPVRGIGVGVPGKVQPEQGIVSFAPSLNWVDFPLKDHLTARYKYPIVIENDVNLAALGETWFGSEGDESNLVLLSIGSRIGAGVVINGIVHGGAHQMAGEVGYFLPDRAHFSKQYPEFGAFEQITSGQAIARQGRQALQGALSQSELDALTAQDVFEAAKRQDPWATEIIDNLADYLAQLVAAFCSILDPDVILLRGGMSKSAELLIEPILQRLKGVSPHLPRVRASYLGNQALVMGAIIRLLRATSKYYKLQKFN